LITGSISQTLLGNSVKVESESGEVFEVGINTNDRFVDVLDNIESYLHSDKLKSASKNTELLDDASLTSINELEWNLVVTHAGITARAKREAGRDYSTPPTKEQKEDIAFIVTELAWSNPISIWNKENEMNSAGARIEQVHPLNFLGVIFTNDRLTAGVSAIKERKVPKIKSTFYKKLAGSLKEEAGRNNLLPFVDDFAKKIQIDKKKILPVLQTGKYEEFIDLLIELKPREGADRHNM